MNLETIIIIVYGCNISTYVQTGGAQLPHIHVCTYMYLGQNHLYCSYSINMPLDVTYMALLRSMVLYCRCFLHVSVNTAYLFFA